MCVRPFSAEFREECGFSVVDVSDNAHIDDRKVLIVFWSHTEESVWGFLKTLVDQSLYEILLERERVGN